MERLISGLGVVFFMGVAFLFCPPALRKKSQLANCRFGATLADRLCHSGSAYASQICLQVRQ